MKDIIILVPVYNDAECAKILCGHPAFSQISHRISSVIIVDDGSDYFDFDKTAYEFPVEIITLRAN
ncbi:MAG: hypothetical protein ABI151_06950, partial [Chitinophagaceae bacterium]